MELMIGIMNDLLGELPFLLLAIIAVLAIGFPIADKVMTRGSSLAKTLFQDDNPAAGLEIGGILLALLFVSYSAISGESMGTLTQDITTTGLAILVSIVAITIAREILGALVQAFNGGKNLNDEIFNQQNMAGAAVSLAMTMAVVNGITEEDMLGEMPLHDGMIALTVMGAGLLAIILYKFTHLRGASFLEEFFADDNPAAGVSLLGFAFAMNLLVSHVTDTVRDADMATMDACIGLLTTALALMISLAILRVLVMVGINKMLSANLHDELFEQNNLGAGFIDAGLTLGCAFLLVSALG